jgi:archaemetzincin
MGSPEIDPLRVARRRVETALHETGHMLGIRHRRRFQCGMNGANHPDEADRRPLWFCPEDKMNAWWACRADPSVRYSRLAECAAAHDLWREAEFWKRSEQTVRGQANRQSRHEIREERVGSH